jgi:hypothetical protein
MVTRVTPFGRLEFDRDAIIHTALRGLVEDVVFKLWDSLGMRSIYDGVWTGNLKRGTVANLNDGDHEVIAWTEAGVVGLAYELGFGPIDQLGLTPDTVTGGPDDVRGAVPGLPGELEPAFQLAASMLDTRSDFCKGTWCSERLAGVGFWLYDDRVEGTLFTDPTAAGAYRLAPWGLIRGGRLPFCGHRDFIALAAERSRTIDAPLHAIVNAVVHRALKGPTEFTTDEIAMVVPKPPDPKQLLGAQRVLQEVGITWPGSPEIPPETPRPKGRNPFLPQP